MGERCECYATVSEDDPRHEIWKHVRADGRLPLKHPLATRADKGPFEGASFYEGDPSRLTQEEKDRLVEKLSEKFGIPRHEIERELTQGILPIKADNVIVSICNLHFRCMM